MKRNFTLVYWLDDGWYVGKLKEVPGVFSQGETLDELIANIDEVYQLMIEEDETDTITEKTDMEIEVGV